MQYLSKIRRTASSLEVTSCNYYIFHQIVVIAIAKWKSSLRQLALFAFAARRFHASLHEGSRCAQDAPQGTGLPIGRWRERTNFPVFIMHGKMASRSAMQSPTAWNRLVAAGRHLRHTPSSGRRNRGPATKVPVLKRYGIRLHS